MAVDPNSPGMRGINWLGNTLFPKPTGQMPFQGTPGTDPAQPAAPAPMHQHIGEIPLADHHEFAKNNLGAVPPPGLEPPAGAGVGGPPPAPPASPAPPGLAAPAAEKTATATDGSQMHWDPRFEKAMAPTDARPDPFRPNWMIHPEGPPTFDANPSPQTMGMHQAALDSIRTIRGTAEGHVDLAHGQPAQGAPPAAGPQGERRLQWPTANLASHPARQPTTG